MIKQIAWNTFKNTGDINTFLEMQELQKIQAGMLNIENTKIEEINGDNKN